MSPSPRQHDIKLLPASVLKWNYTADKKQCVTDPGKMLPCQVALRQNTKPDLTVVLHIMKILMMRERGIFLARLHVAHSSESAKALYVM